MTNSIRGRQPPYRRVVAEATEAEVETEAAAAAAAASAAAAAASCKPRLTGFNFIKTVAAAASDRIIKRMQVRHRRLEMFLLSGKLYQTRFTVFTAARFTQPLPHKLSIRLTIAQVHGTSKLVSFSVRRSNVASSLCSAARADDYSSITFGWSLNQEPRFSLPSSLV